MRTYFLALCTLAFFASCETIVEVDVPRQPDKLVVNAIFSTDQEWQAQVFKSRYILENNNDPFYITNATIQLFVDGQPGGVFTFNSDSYRYQLDAPKPVPGKRYSIVVNAPGFPEATAEDVIMPAPIITLAAMDGVVDSNDFESIYPIKIRFKDAPGKSKYGISVIRYTYTPKYNEFGEIIGRDSIPSFLSLFSQNPLLERDESQEYELYVTDFFEDGAEVEFKFQATGFNYDYSNYDFDYEGPLVVEVRNMSEATHLYVRNINNYQFNVGNPFSEPVQVFNNIKNGFGIFGGFSLDSKQLPRFVQGN